MRLHCCLLVLSCLLSVVYGTPSSPNFIRHVTKGNYNCLFQQGNYLYAGFSTEVDAARFFSRWTLTPNGLSNEHHFNFSFPKQQGTPGSFVVDSTETFLYFGLDDSNHLCRGSFLTNKYLCAVPTVALDSTGLGWRMTPSVHIDELNHRVLYQTEYWVHSFNSSVTNMTEIPSQRIQRWATTSGNNMINSYLNVSEHKLFVQLQEEVREYNLSSRFYPLNYTRHPGVAAGGSGKAQKAMLWTSSGCWVFTTDYDYSNAHLKKWCPSQNTTLDIVLPLPVKTLPVICEDTEEQVLYMLGNNNLISVVATFDLKNDSFIGYSQMPYTYAQVKGCYLDSANRYMYVAAAWRGLGMFALHWVTSVSPYYVNPNGGTILTVQGRGFRDTPNLTCSFMGLANVTKPLGVTFVSTVEILCAAPAFDLSLLNSPQVSLEISLDGQEFTSNGVQFMFQGLGQVAEIVPPSKPLSGIQLVTVQGFGFVDARFQMKCRFGFSNSDIVPASFVDTRAVLCIAPARTQPSTEPVFVTYNDGQDWSTSSGNFTWIGPPISMTAQGSPLFFAYTNTCQISTVVVRAFDSAATFVDNKDPVVRTITITPLHSNATLLSGSSVTATMTNGIASFSNIRLSVAGLGKYFLLISSPGIASTFLEFEIGRCPLDPNQYPAGYTLQDSSCIPCDVDTYKPFVGSSMCLQCPTHTSTLGKLASIAQTDCVCAPGYYSFDGQPDCMLCPEGALCPGGDQLSILSGFWHSNPFSPRILACDVPSNCNPPPGGPIELSRRFDTNYQAASGPSVICSEGTTGPLCSACLEGWVLDSGHCLKCPDRKTAITSVVFVIVASFLGIILIVRATVQDCERSLGGLRKPHYMSVIIKILLSFTQLNAMALLLPSEWPSLLYGILSAERTSSGPSINNSFVKCALNLSTLDESLFMLLLPICILVFAIALFVGWYILSKGTELIQETIESAEQGEAPKPKKLFFVLLRNPERWDRCMDYLCITILATFFLIHPTLTEKSVNNLRCDSIDGKLFMSADRSIVCGSPLHFKIFSASLAVFILYSLGFPILALFLLFVNRHDLDDPDTKRRLGFLYISYRCGDSVGWRQTQKDLFDISWKQVLHRPLPDTLRHRAEKIRIEEQELINDLRTLRKMPPPPSTSLEENENENEKYRGKKGMAIGAWYHEAFVTLRKVAVIFGILIFKGSPIRQSYFVSWVILAALMLQMVTKPYQNAIQNTLETVSLFCNFLTIQGAIFFSSSTLSPNEKLAITVAISLANLSLLLSFFVQILRALMSQFREVFDLNKDGKVSWQEARLALLEFFGLASANRHFQAFLQASLDRDGDGKFSFNDLQFGKTKQKSNGWTLPILNEVHPGTTTAGGPSDENPRARENENQKSKNQVQQEFVIVAKSPKSSSVKKMLSPKRSAEESMERKVFLERENESSSRDSSPRGEVAQNRQPPQNERANNSTVGIPQTRRASGTLPSLPPTVVFISPSEDGSQYVSQLSSPPIDHRQQENQIGDAPPVVAPPRSRLPPLAPAAEEHEVIGISDLPNSQ